MRRRDLREEHDNAIAYDFPVFPKPLTSDELIAQLGSSRSVNPIHQCGEPSRP